MIYGILSAVVFAIALATALVGKRLKQVRTKKTVFLIHKISGYFFAVMIFVHLTSTLWLFWQRPLAIFIFGAAMVLCTAASILVRLIKSKRIAFRWHKILAYAVIPLLAVHVAICIISFQQYLQKVNAITFTNPVVSEVADGSYTGECDVGYIYAKVEVTVQNGVITHIDLVQHRNERGKAAEGLVGQILSQQRTDVDAVSSATNSSKVIKKAIENALTQGLGK